MWVNDTNITVWKFYSVSSTITALYIYRTPHNDIYMHTILIIDKIYNFWLMNFEQNMNRQCVVIKLYQIQSVQQIFIIWIMKLWPCYGTILNNFSCIDFFLILVLSCSEKMIDRLNYRYINTPHQLSSSGGGQRHNDTYAHIYSLFVN